MTPPPASLPVPLDALASIGPVGVGVLDADLRYVFVDETLARANGREVADHTGRTLREVLPDAADLVEPLVHRALAGEPTHDLRLDALSEDGRRFRGSFLPAQGPDGPLCVGILVEDHREDAVMALRITEERLRLALEGIEVGFWEWDVAQNQIRWSENHGPLFGLPRGTQPPDYEAFIGYIHPEDRERVQRVVGDALEGRGWFDREWRIVRPDGVVRWVESRGHLLRGAGGAPLAIVGLTTDVTARRRRDERHAFLSQATALLARSLDPEETLGEIVRSAVPDLAEWCVVHLPGPGGRPEVASAAHADQERLADALEFSERYPPDPDAPTGVPAVLRTGRAELYGDIPDEMLVALAVDEDHLAMIRALRMRAVMIVPMVARGDTLGVLTFIASDAQGAYDEDDLATAEELGRRAGLALDNARLHTEQQRAIERLEALQSVTDVGLAHLDLSDLLRELLDRVREVTRADTAAILLPDEEGAGLRVVTSVGISGDATRPGRDLIEVPLLHEGREIGVLQLGSSQDQHFDADHRALLELVAQRAALAIAHARLYERARDVAVTLQRSLLPDAPGDVDGLDLAVRYLPGQEGAEVGGDWYDVVTLPDDRVVLIVGDVEGRGTTAAALMGRLRAVLRAYVFDAQGPADALTRLDLLLGEQPEADFATVVIASVAPDRRSMTVCCAGHPPPLLLPPDGRPHLLGVLPGVPVGAPAPPRSEVQVPLEPGTRVLLYTDGLVERRSVALQDRFDRLVEAAGWAPGGSERLLDHVIAEMQDASQADDVALLAAHVDVLSPGPVVR